ncbi:hypothetical protein [Bradyrhizobium sp. AUGA SZCCT0182]|uniref:hypothetical protein n=1 Tax=Bradyrhizobium sp. AUGA SZCCT0182 TaxID=2807667 RepID=UPI001BA86789|nr:hypothetical protein [Bradyrhizobium sp. AUGA SZCCT0182]MBR1235230.1 hypothetical protein [Bradyrhizobium sp. AUGA SZCCT0182]
MTARAGDALSHDYFSWPLIQFSKASFSASFPAPVRSETPVTILPRRPAPERRVSDKLNRSARICMGAMYLRNNPNPVPRRLLAVTS